MPSTEFTMVDALRVGAFSGSIGLTYYLGLRWLLEWIRRRKPRNVLERVLHKTGPFFFVLSVVGLGCMAYGFFVEPFRLTVTNYTIETPKLPKDERIRIVHLADLHVREKGPRENALPELVRSLKPDLILHTGDFFARRSNIEPIVVQLLKCWTVPQFACRGNLDRLGNFDETMENGSVRVLRAAAEHIEIRKIPLTVSGFASGGQLGMKPVLERLPGDTFNIVLYHHPCGFLELEDTPADLMLAGHTHGGQVRLPFYGALVTMDPCGKRYEYGRYDEHGATLIVSRGLGGEPATPEVRFLCPPEVVVIDLIGTAKNDKS